MDEAELIKMIPHVVRSSTKKVWIDYDEEADVLYVSFVYPPNAIEHEEDEDVEADPEPNLINHECVWWGYVRRLQKSVASESIGGGRFTRSHHGVGLRLPRPD